MGKTLTGGTSYKGNISMLTPEQQSIMSSYLTQLGPQAQQTLQGLLQPMSQEESQNVFQQSYVQPALQTYQQQILPSIQQRYDDLNAGSSSALNQALAQSAENLSTSLGSQYGNFLQNQQQRQLQAANQFLPLLNQQTFSPMIQQREGILGPLIEAIGKLGGAYALSSKNVKENVRDYDLGLDVLMSFDVKKYDYIQEVGGQKNRIGLIAEQLPKDLTLEKDGILHVDLYGLVCLLINCVKEVNNKLDEIEERLCQLQ